MTLGFSVEALVPAGRGGKALRMGLVRLGEGEWLWPDFDRAARARTFAAHPESVLARPGSAAPAREAARLVAGRDSLGEAAACVWEDLCIMQADADGGWRLTAAAVGFPTDWQVADKMGMALPALHAPIHGYAEELSASVDRFFSVLKPGQIFGRANWFIVASDALRYLPGDDPAERFAHVSSANAGETLFVRCERQTLRRLPESGAVLFTIGIALAPLGSLSGAVVMQLARTVAAMGAGEQDRRAAPHYAPALMDHAAARGWENAA
ncbi:MAG: DUF3445 domain-containing protein [Sphingomonadales bacterium]|nr:DUF3445 domain-containing protein [Sphingomonadales bacterium]